MIWQWRGKIGLEVLEGGGREGKKEEKDGGRGGGQKMEQKSLKGPARLSTVTQRHMERGSNWLCCQV